MSGPRDFRRGAKPFERPADLREVVGAKSHFTWETKNGRWIISIHRRGCAEETVICDTPGQFNQMRMRLSDAGLIGVSKEGRS